LEHYFFVEESAVNHKPIIGLFKKKPDTNNTLKRIDDSIIEVQKHRVWLGIKYEELTVDFLSYYSYIVNKIKSCPEKIEEIAEEEYTVMLNYRWKLEERYYADIIELNNIEKFISERRVH